MTFYTAATGSKLVKSGMVKTGSATVRDVKGGGSKAHISMMSGYVITGKESRMRI